MTDKTLEYVSTIPMVQKLLADIAESKLATFFDHYREQFMIAPAASTMHHNFTHGLVIHTAEVWQAAMKFVVAAPASEAAKARVAAGDWYETNELLVAVVLHDFAKIVQYAPANNFSWTKITMIANQECWTLRELSKFGVTLTDNEFIGLLHAEGGYTEFAVDWRPLSAILHAADLWSSQAMRAIWNPAEVLNVICPLCKSPMREISGKNGVFYGCSKYASGCRGTRNATEVPPVGDKFLEWLKQMYPFPSDQIPLAI
jgi:hypothetical protein